MVANACAWISNSDFAVDALCLEVSD